MERIDGLLPDAGKAMSGSSANRKKQSAKALRLDDQVCPHCGADLEAQWVEFPPALQRKYGKQGEWDYLPCTPECEKKDEQREWERNRRESRVETLRERSGLSKRMKNHTLSSFKPYTGPSAAKAMEKVEAYLKNWEENRDSGRGMYFCGDVGTGKCVAASESLHLADGRRVRASDLVGREFELLTLVDEKPVAVKARAEWNAVEPVWEIETETGKRVVRNAEHPLYVGESPKKRRRNKEIDPCGWRPISSITPGQAIAASDALPAFGDERRLPEDEIKLLAYMIGDGGLTQSTTRFSQLPGAQLEEMRYIVERLGARLIPHHGVDYRIVGTESRASESRSPTGVATHRFNRMAEVLKRHGLAGMHSREKRIPEAVFGLARDQLVLFLSRLYATDGWAYSRGPKLTRLGRVEIGFCSASEGLVRDIQELLVKLGVTACVKKRKNINAWCLNINDARQVAAFADEVGIFGKEKAVEAARDVATGIVENGKKRERWRLQNSPEGTHWETVIGVRRAGVEPTVAIEVPEHHTFLTLFWEHNTHLACAVMHELIQRKRVPSLFVTVPELLDNIREAYNVPGRNIDEWMDAVRNAEFLLLDDLGAERASEWVRERIFVIVNHRYREELPTLFTSNVGPKDLAAQLGARTASRIIEMCDWISLEGEDYREMEAKQRA
ncbi:MAG: ATP-binding protein [Rubrobacter sp.]|nr:ATP-binding protein [Rubrobacter sp.]